MEFQYDLRRYLNSLYWLGGSTASGKTTICSHLTERFGATVHQRDDAIEDHWTRINPQDHPALYEWCDYRKRGRVQEFIRRPIDDLVNLLVTAFREDFSLTLADLSEMKLGPRTIVEDLRFSPDSLVPLLADKRRAVWIVPSLDLHKDLISRRTGKQTVSKTPREAAREKERLALVFNEIAMTLGRVAEERGAEVLRIANAQDLKMAPDCIAKMWGFA